MLCWGSNCNFFLFWFSRFFLWNTAKTWSKVQVTTEIILAQHLGYKVLPHIHVIFYRSSVHYYWKWMFSCWTILSEVIPTHCDIMTPTCTYSYYFKLSNTYVALQRWNRNFELRDNLCNCRHFFGRIYVYNFTTTVTSLQCLFISFFTF